MASGFLTFLTMRGAAARRGFALFIFVIFGAFALSVALADKAAAQQTPATSVNYAAYPSDLVSISAEKGLVVLQQPSAGLMTATIVGTSYILSGGEYIRNPAVSPGMTLITLRFLSSCSVKDGCAAFGLDGLADTDARIAAFRAMDITTMRQFAASGADLNEIPIDGGNAEGYLLYLLANTAIPDGEAHPNLAKMSVLVAAGANVNSKDEIGGTMLHQASTTSSDAMTGLLAMPGVSVNITNAAGRTPLDDIAGAPSFLFTTNPALNANAGLLRAAGGRCEAITNKPDICGE